MKAYHIEPSNAILGMFANLYQEIATHMKIKSLSSKGKTGKNNKENPRN